MKNAALYGAAAVALFFLYLKVYRKRENWEKPCLNCTRFREMTPTQIDQDTRRKIHDITNAPRIADVMARQPPAHPRGRRRRRR